MRQLLAAGNETTLVLQFHPDAPRLIAPAVKRMLTQIVPPDATWVPQGSACYKCEHRGRWFHLSRGRCNPHETPTAPSHVPQVPLGSNERVTQQRPTRPLPPPQAAKPPPGQFKISISPPTPPPSKHIKTQDTRALSHSVIRVSSGQFSALSSSSSNGVLPLGQNAPFIALVSNPSPLPASPRIERNSGVSIPPLQLSPISADSPPPTSSSRIQPEATWLPYPFPRNSEPHTPPRGAPRYAPASSPISSSSSVLSLQISGTLFPSPAADFSPSSSTSGPRGVGCSPQDLQRAGSRSPRIETDVPRTPGKGIEALLRPRAAPRQPRSPGLCPVVDQPLSHSLPPSGDVERCPAIPSTPGKSFKRRLSWENSRL